MIEIRDIGIDDIESLAQLYRNFWNENYTENFDVQKMKSKFTEIQTNPAYILLGAVEGDGIAGSVMGIVCEDLYGKCKPLLLLENMVVDSSYRKMGIGTKLYDELEKRAKEKGCRQIILVTEADREVACKFYESVGFHPTANKGYKKRIY